MFRVVTTRRLLELEATIGSLRTEVQHVRAAGQTILREKVLAEQARDFYQAQATKWEGRASRFIDQIGVTSGTLATSAMDEPAAPPEHDSRRIFAALGHHSLKVLPDHARPSPSAEILGVDADIARAAVEGALTP